MHQKYPMHDPFVKYMDFPDFFSQKANIAESVSIPLRQNVLSLD